MAIYSFGALCTGIFTKIVCEVCGRPLCRCYGSTAIPTDLTQPREKPKILYKCDVAEIELICPKHHKPSAFRMSVTSEEIINVQESNLTEEVLFCPICHYPIAHVKYDKNSGIRFKVSDGKDGGIVTYSIVCPENRKHPHTAYITVYFDTEAAVNSNVQEPA